jgi:NAD(P)H-flavin reductase
MTLELEPLDGKTLDFLPGQFNMLYLFGIGEVPISISGDPARPRPTVHTLRAVGAVTRGLAALAKGAVVGLRGPFGTGWPMAAARGHDVVIIGGGIGLAPLRPAIYHILAHRRDYGRVTILHGARSPRDLLHTKELERWRSRFDLEVEVTVDRAAPGWHGRVGVVTILLGRAGFDPPATVAMACGPEVMMRYAVRELVRKGVPDEQIWVSLERNMKCAVGFCGHCQFGPTFVCKDGPVFPHPRVASLLGTREV